MIDHTTEYFDGGGWSASQPTDSNAVAVVTYTDEPSPETGDEGWCWWAMGHTGEAATRESAKAAAVDSLDRLIDKHFRCRCGVCLAMSDDSPFDESDLDRIGTLARRLGLCGPADKVSRYSGRCVPLKDACARNFVIEEELATTRFNAKPASKTDKVDAFCAWDGEGEFMSQADNIDASMGVSSELEAVRKAIASAPAEIANHPERLTREILEGINDALQWR